MSYFHPQRMPVLSARRRKAARLQLEQIVTRSATSRWRQRPAVLAALMAIITLSTAGAAIAVVASHTVTNRAQARCYAVADTSSQDFTTIAQASTSLTPAEVRNALGVCQELYRIGMLVKGHPVMRPPFKSARNAPPLVACVWRDGTAAVFPGRQGTCATLGLPAAARR
jgi:hypothetical protein